MRPAIGLTPAPICGEKWKNERKDLKTKTKFVDVWPRFSKKLTSSATFFDGVHIFTPHGDVPDDGVLRLIVMPPEQSYSREEKGFAFDGRA